MSELSWFFFAALATMIMMFMGGLVGYGMGQESLRHNYNRCVEVGAPPENCLKMIMGEKI